MNRIVIYIRRIAIVSKSHVRFYEIKSEDRPLTLVGRQLYRTDNNYMLKNRAAADEFALYDFDGVTPYGVEDPPSPDETMAYIDVARSSSAKTSKVRIWPKWLTMDKIAIGIVVILIVYQYIK